MIYTKTNPNSIDYSIQTFQQAVYAGILKVWPSAVYESYGRCSPVRTPNGYVATVYNGGVDYKTVAWDDGTGSDIQSFFGYSGNIIRDRTLADAMIHMVVFCDLTRLYPAAEYRMDEEVKMEFLRIFQKALYGFHYDSMELGIERVLREYRGTLVQPGIDRMDMHPLHCFRFNFLISYNPFQSNSLKL